MAKKNNVELYKIIPDSKIYDIRLCTDGVTGFTEAIHESDLKDLRSLIDTVLGEEKECHYKKHTHKTSSELFSCPCCVRNLEQEDVIRVDSQPLIEVEGKKCPYRNEECPRCYPKHQESNKEGEPLQKAFTRGNSCLSKKPSMTIGCMECGNNIKI